MKPINKKNFRATGMGVSFYNGTAVVTGYVVKQSGTNKFVVTDGVNTMKVRLAQTTAFATSLASHPTFCTIPLETLSVGKGASFTPHYKVQSGTVVNSTGTGWNVGDTLSLPSGAGTLTVATVGTGGNAGKIATVTVGTAGDYTAFPPRPATCTRAAGTGGTFTAHYGVDSVSVAAKGSAYAIGNVLALTGTTSGTVTVDTVDGAGGVLTYHVTAAGDVTALPANPLAVTGGAGTGATFNAKYKLISVASSGGTGYNVGDTLVFTGLVATTAPTAHISVATSHAATTVVVDSAGSGITTAATAVATNPTTATFNLSYQLLSIAVAAAGTGYTNNQVLIFNGMGATTHPTAHISAVGGGGTVTTAAMDTAGSGITVAATSVSAAGVVEHVARIWDSRCRTTEGHSYKWNINSSINGSAVIQGYNY